MVKIEEEEPAGVPAFMATFADLMTLLLVFFILLNVYAKEKQHGLLSAASGAFSAAIGQRLGAGGLINRSQYLQQNQYTRRTFRHDDGSGASARDLRSGDEVEIGRNQTEKLEATDQIELAAPFRFGHGEARLNAKGRKFFDELSRDLRDGNFIVELHASAGFHEAMMPMELAAERIRRMTDYLRRVGVTAELEMHASVASRGAGSESGAAGGVVIRVTRRR